ncbi:cytochrome c3 family protein [Desulfatiglans anilini]|uniref:cytochrome c3 family protein n=1 Tax=Desulfatiglans anilini TaxID=90728 RepID=UPI0004002ACC|nr:cytochrome c3 family protein [Desulfatiglans anilini]
MNKKFLSLLTVVFCGLMLCAVGAITAADVAEEIVLQNEYPADKQGPVKFSHKKHAEDYGATCDDCHHVIQDGKNVWKEGDAVQKCSECHPADPPDKEALKLQNAFHKNCKDCHKEQNDDAKAPFKKCNGCHEKKG